MNYKRLNFFKELGCVPLLILDNEYSSNQGKARNKQHLEQDENKDPWNRAVCERIKAIGEEVGIDVFWIDATEENMPLGERAYHANDRLKEWKKRYDGKASDRFCASISKRYSALNDSWNQNKGGVETIYYVGRDDSKRFAATVQKWLTRGTKLTDRGIRAGNFAMIREVLDCPAIITDAVFTDLREQEFLMKNELHQQEVAEKTVSAFLEWLGAYKLEEEEMGIEEPAWPEPYFEYLNSLLKEAPIAEKRYNAPLTRGDAFRIITDVTKVLTESQNALYGRLERLLTQPQGIPYEDTSEE